jgi:energy-coupling factor transporter transmembrane protein EcfT
MKRGVRKKSLTDALIDNSPLRQVDPRVKMAISLCVSLAVMLPMERLVIFMGGYVLLLGWARLWSAAARQVWRIKWVLLVIFLVDWLLVDLPHAFTVAMRLVLLAGVLALAFATTTPREFGLALEGLGLPYRYAFSLGLAFNSLQLLDEEWHAIREAQAARGILPAGEGLVKLVRQIGDLIALTVPAVVLTTKRAWSITESAYARGFDSPQRSAYHHLQLSWWDVALLAGVLTVIFVLFWWR